jgi:hypothetical protein
VRLLLALLAVLALTAPRAASAGTSVGVLVTGEYLKAPTQQQVEKWMRAHSQRVVSPALPTDAVSSLLNCFVLDDPKCMRSIVDARSTTDMLVSIRVDLASKKAREIRLTIDWFVKGHSPISSRRTCDKCTETVLRSTIDAMLSDLSKTAPGFMGTLKVSSTPPGITVLVDNATIGVTPVETRVPVGDHKVQLARDGRVGDIKTVSVTGEAVTAVDLEAPAAATIKQPLPETPPPSRPSRLLPGLVIGLGVAAIGAGTTLYLTSEEPTGKRPTYRDTKNLGIGVAAGGGALVLTGVIIVLATKPSQAPTIAFTPGGATIGWAGSF